MLPAMLRDFAILRLRRNMTVGHWYISQSARGHATYDVSKSFPLQGNSSYSQLDLV